MLAEATTTTISKRQEPENLAENINVAKQGGGIAGDARKSIEAATGEPVITSKNAVDFSNLIVDVIADAPDEEDDE
jgi:hypothetical protein